jgi:hypothetical protein
MLASLLEVLSDTRNHRLGEGGRGRKRRSEYISVRRRQVDRAEERERERKKKDGRRESVKGTE